MNALISELGKRLPDRWLVQVFLAGLLWSAAAFIAHDVGHAHALDPRSYTMATRDLSVRLSGSPSSAAAILLRAVALAALAAFAAQAFALGVRALSLGQWKGIAAPAARRLTRIRRSRAEERARREAPDHQPPAVYLPQRPTWIGDRLRLTDARIHAQYHLRLSLIWSRLWLILDPEIRNEVRSTQSRYEAGFIRTAWSLPYFILAFFSWPYAFISILVAALGWRYTRAATMGFSQMVESVVDIHHSKLAESLGHPITQNGMTTEIAGSINDLLNKGA